MSLKRYSNKINETRCNSLLPMCNECCKKVLSSTQDMCGSRGGNRGSGPPPTLKNHKNIGFSRNTGPDPLKNRSYQASIQCWDIISTPAKRHLEKKKKKKKNVVKVGPPLTKLSGSAHARTRYFAEKYMFPAGNKTRV